MRRREAPRSCPVASGHRGLVVIAGLILAEELYETGTLALIIRIGGKAAPLPGTAPLSRL